MGDPPESDGTRLRVSPSPNQDRRLHGDDERRARRIAARCKLETAQREQEVLVELGAQRVLTANAAAQNHEVDRVAVSAAVT
jgi:hypothetical protein